jgi:cell division septum initiation protein DivIVA
MTDQIKGMSEEQVRQFLDYIAAEDSALETSRMRRISSGHQDLSYHDKMELARLRQTKQMFLKILGSNVG